MFDMSWDLFGLPGVLFLEIWCFRDSMLGVPGLRFASLETSKCFGFADFGFFPVPFFVPLGRPEAPGHA